MTVSDYLGDMALCTENNHNHACIFFSNFQAHGNSVILAEQIVGCGVSLSDSICHEQTKSVSLFEGLPTLTDGHLTIKVVLDTLLTKTPTGDIQIKLGYGVIITASALTTARPRSWRTF